MAIYPNIDKRASDWTSYPGREIQYEYYTGTEPESGGMQNMKRAIYIEDGFIRFVQNFEWNPDGSIKREYCTKS